MDSKESGANLFRITQTEARMRRDSPQGLDERRRYDGPCCKCSAALRLPHAVFIDPVAVRGAAVFIKNPFSAVLDLPEIVPYAADLVPAGVHMPYLPSETAWR